MKSEIVQEEKQFVAVEKERLGLDVITGRKVISNPLNRKNIDIFEVEAYLNTL
jgi:hypothetical protein